MSGLNESAMAPCPDVTAGDSLADLRGPLERLRDAGLHEQLAEGGSNAFDGQGARRAARVLTELFRAARDGG